jgi:hypothetical protein
MKLIIIIIGFSLSFSAMSSDKVIGLDVPNARQMYVSCLLLQDLEFLSNQKSMYAEPRCAEAILGLIVRREGKGNRNSGQKDARLNFCLPKTSNTSALMSDAYIMDYESRFISTSAADPTSFSGLAIFAVALAQKYPCL